MYSNTIAIIPARGGSKRIPRKNIRNFLGKPIISYSIEAAKKTGIFSEITVSTDDLEIAEISKQFGASIPFLRSSRNSDDFSPLKEVIKEVLANYSIMGKEFDYICCILPTSPMVSSENIFSAYNLIEKENGDSTIAVVKYSHPIQRALRIQEGKIQFCWPEHRLTRTNDLETSYHDTGSFYWIRRSSFEKQDQIFMQKSIPFELSEETVQDIDNETDWKLAELKYQFMINEKVREKREIS